MKKLVVTDKSACKACLQCEIACSTAFYKVFDPEKSCIRIVEKNGAVKTNVCIQCGKCARVCPEGAISQNAKGTYVINKKLCVGVMVKVPESPVASKCIACGICAKACPMGILEVQDK